MAFFLFAQLCLAELPLVLIDIGHTPLKSGALSARGEPEYVFNRRVALALGEALNLRGKVKALVLNEAGAELSLSERVVEIRSHPACLLLSLHHDAAQPQFMKYWKPEGSIVRPYCDDYAGFSLFVSKQNRVAERSLELAGLLAGALHAAGYQHTDHHAAAVDGERREAAPAPGVFYYDELAVLRGPYVPSCLLECGVIVNRGEELRLSDPVCIQRFVAVLLAPLEAFVTAKAGG